MYVVWGIDDVKQSSDQVEGPVDVSQGWGEYSSAGSSASQVQLGWSIEGMSDGFPLYPCPALASSVNLLFVARLQIPGMVDGHTGEELERACCQEIVFANPDDAGIWVEPRDNWILECIHGTY